MRDALRTVGVARVGFVVWALIVVTLTHWPQLQIDTGIPRTDLWAHFTVMFIWTTLLMLTGWLGPRGSWRNPALAVPLAIAYAGLDEISQGIPGLGRIVAWSDFAANCIGVEIAAVVWIAVLLARGWGNAGG